MIDNDDFRAETEQQRVFAMQICSILGLVLFLLFVLQLQDGLEEIQTATAIPPRPQTTLESVDLFNTSRHLIRGVSFSFLDPFPIAFYFRKEQNATIQLLGHSGFIEGTWESSPTIESTFDPMNASFEFPKAVSPNDELTPSVGVIPYVMDPSQAQTKLFLCNSDLSPCYFLLKEVPMSQCQAPHSNTENSWSCIDPGSEAACLQMTVQNSPTVGSSQPQLGKRICGRFQKQAIALDYYKERLFLVEAPASVGSRQQTHESDSSNDGYCVRVYHFSAYYNDLSPCIPLALPAGTTLRAKNPVISSYYDIRSESLVVMYYNERNYFMLASLDTHQNMSPRKSMMFEGMSSGWIFTSDAPDMTTMIIFDKSSTMYQSAFDVATERLYF